MSHRPSARSALAWSGRHSLGTLLAVVGLSAGLWVFAAIADRVRDGQATTVDERVVMALREAGDPHDPVGPAWLEGAVRDVTSLGGNTVLALLVLGVAGFLVLRRAAGMALVLLGATSSAVLLGWTLKGAFGRPRPDLVPHLMEASHTAFPSGHALGATAVYLTLAALLAAVQASPVVKAYLLSWSLLISIAVGLSRVYLGVHWPTDVAAGWAIGAAWASAWWLLVRILLRREVIRYPASSDGA